MRDGRMEWNEREIGCQLTQSKMYRLHAYALFSSVQRMMEWLGHGCDAMLHWRGVLGTNRQSGRRWALRQPVYCTRSTPWSLRLGKGCPARERRRVMFGQRCSEDE